MPLGSVTVLGGEPGIGKSTIALQWSSALAMAPENTAGLDVLYLGAEENALQVKSRALRLCLPGLARLRILPIDRVMDASLDRIMQRNLFGLMVDSIPGFTNDPEEAVSLLQTFKRYATAKRMPVVVINHITKDGEMAGLMKLQHAGDISLLMTKASGDHVVKIPGAKGKMAYRSVKEPRTLYTDKSRYGPSAVETYYAMTVLGLEQIELNEDDAMM
jgi:DNA repair protein RadA/Sms